MGADIRTFSVRRGTGREVRDLVVSWLGAKGFVICDETSLFPFDSETERGVVLTETSDWLTVTFSHGFEEGDRRHRCSVELPESAETTPAVGLHAVFSFQLGSVHVQCDALRPSQLREQLKIWSGIEVLEDEKHFIGDLPARSVQLRYSSSNQIRRLIWHLVETPQAVYRFHSSEDNPPEDVQQEFRTVFDSFRLEEAA